MILQALTRLYDRLTAQKDSGLAAYGYSTEKISYEIVLNPQGHVMAVNPLFESGGKKPRPKFLTVPQGGRTSGIKSNFLWDKTSYALGVSLTSKRAEKEHQAFKDLHFTALHGTDDEGLLALVHFLQNWTPAMFEASHFPPEMKDLNLVFRLDQENGFLHDRPAARAIRSRLLAAQTDSETGEEGKEASDSAFCLVTGQWGPVARTHAVIKGVYDAQSSGAAIVSFQQESFRSFDKLQGSNAPVSLQASFAYTTALNYLLRSNTQRLQIGDSSVVFWAEAATAAQALEAEDLLASLFNEPLDDSQEAERVRTVLEGISKGRPLTDLTPKIDPNTRIFVLGLAPNAARISIRFWLEDRLDALTQKIALHAQDFRIEPLPWKTAPAARRIVLATVPHREGAMPKSDDAIKNMVGELMRSILTGRAYPRSLLANTVMRIRADGNLSGMRAAICKGVLTREQRLHPNPSKEEIAVSLDTASTQPGYLLGRLFSTLEYIQSSALGTVNASIRDRYYGAASATPASIFPVLLRNTQNHLAKVRKDKPAFAIVLERQINDIVNGLPSHFPRSLHIEDQGRFAIGYYHQNKAFYTKAPSATAHPEAADEATEETPSTEGKAP